MDSTTTQHRTTTQHLTTRTTRLTRIITTALLLLLVAGATSVLGAKAAGAVPEPRLKYSKSTAGAAKGSKGSSSTNTRPATTRRNKEVHRYGETANPQGTTNWTSMPEFLQFLMGDADGFWTNVLVRSGAAEPYVRYVFPMPGEQRATPCGTTDDRTAMYCPADDTIYVSQEMARAIWEGDLIGPDGQRAAGTPGDFGVAFVIAHEFAHSIQQEVGLAGRYTVPQLEKHADCWAGVWAHDAEARNLLDPGDIEQGDIVAALVGDSHFESENHHGTSAERVTAFEYGYRQGIPSSCDLFLGR